MIHGKKKLSRTDLSGKVLTLSGLTCLGSLSFVVVVATVNV